MAGFGIFLGVHANKPNTEFGAGLHDAHGDFATVGDEDFVLVKAHV